MTRAARRAEEPVVYWLDSEDRILRFNAAWVRFARSNGAPALARPEIAGRGLWELVRGAEIHQLYQHLFEKVRRRRSPLVLPFRCDAPALRRFMELEIAPGSGDALLLSARTLRLEGREAVTLIDPRTRRSNDVLTMCSLCKRILVDEAAGRWLEVDEAIRVLDLFGRLVLPQLSHSVCFDCEARAHAVLLER